MTKRRKILGATQAASILREFTTLEDLVGGSDQSVFTPVARVDAHSFADQDGLANHIQQHVLEKGLPLVLENSLDAFGLDDDVVSVQALETKFGETEITVRDMRSGKDLHGWTVAGLLQHFGRKHEKRLTLDVYGKDIPSHQDLTAHLYAKLPFFLSADGPGDLLGYLPPALKTENIMLYIGTDQTWTACHFDACRTIGHNLMLHCDSGASSLWFMTSCQDTKELNNYVEREWDTRVDFDNNVFPLSVLERSPVPIHVVEQKQGDLVIIPPWSAHQVVNRGDGVSIKISWNRMRAQDAIDCLETELPLLSHICKPSIYDLRTAVMSGLEFYTKKLDPDTFDIKEGYWQQNVFAEVRALCSAFCRILLDEHAEDATGQSGLENFHMLQEAVEDSLTCDFCRGHIFNGWFHCSKCPETGVDICVPCVARGRACRHGLSALMPCKRYDYAVLFDKLAHAVHRHNQCVVRHALPYPQLQVPDIGRSAAESATYASLAVASRLLAGQRARARCHQCRRMDFASQLLQCTKSDCSRVYCGKCLWSEYGERFYDLVRKKIWECHWCCGDCICEACRNNPDFVPRGKSKPGELRWRDAFYDVPDQKRFIGSFFDVIRVQWAKNACHRDPPVRQLRRRKISSPNAWRNQNAVMAKNSEIQGKATDQDGTTGTTLEQGRTNGTTLEEGQPNGMAANQGGMTGTATEHHRTTGTETEKGGTIETATERVAMTWTATEQDGMTEMASERDRMAWTATERDRMAWTATEPDEATLLTTVGDGRSRAREVREGSAATALTVGNEFEEARAVLECALVWQAADDLGAQGEPPIGPPMDPSGSPIDPSESLPVSEIAHPAFLANMTATARANIIAQQLRRYFSELGFRHTQAALRTALAGSDSRSGIPQPTSADRLAEFMCVQKMACELFGAGHPVVLAIIRDLTEKGAGFLS